MGCWGVGLWEPNAVGLREAAHVLDAGVLRVLLFVAVPKDRARRMVWKFGRRLRGPELATTAEFNEKLGRKKWLTTYFPDGIAFVNLEQTWFDRLLGRDRGRWVRVPREREAMHFLIVGD